MDFNDDENIDWLMESSKTVDHVVEDDVACELGERESQELCTFLQLLRSVFESEPILVESKAKGTILSEENVQSLLKKLQAFGYFFAVRTSRRSVNKGSELRIFSKKTHSCATPYRVNSTVYYYCSFGRKPREKSKAEPGASKKRLKSSCNGLMQISQLEVFNSVLLSSSKRKNSMILKKLKTRLKNPNMRGSIKYSVIVSLPRVHNHPRTIHGHALNEDVKACLLNLHQSGVHKASEIQSKLEALVNMEFLKEPVKPAMDNTAFYPSKKTIYSYLRAQHKPQTSNSQVNSLHTSIDELWERIRKRLYQTKNDNVLSTSLVKIKEMETWLLTQDLE